MEIIEHDKELIRRALLGSREAQKECTRRGIVLPCPFCGSENTVISNWGLWRVWCQECLGKSDDQLSQADAIRKWNTRPAPPIGRCKDCRWYEYGKAWYPYCNHPDGLANSVKTTDFCSFFEPKED